MHRKATIETVVWLALPFALACVWLEQIVEPLSARLLLGGVLILGLIPAAVLLRHRRRLLAARVAERELRVSERRYRSLFENVIEGIYQSSLDGRMLNANPALVRMLGYDSVEDLRKIDIATDLYSDPEEREYLMRRMEAEGELRNFEITLKRKDGTLLTVLENGRLVFDERTGETHHEGTLTDVTDRKHAERELLRYTFEAEVARRRVEDQAEQVREQAEQLRIARDEALEASRLKSEFLANVSHEIRTPMNGIIGMTHLLLDTDLSEDQRDFAGTVRSSADYLLTIINDILDFSKFEAGRLTLHESTFSIRSLVDGLMDLLAERAEQKNIELLCVVESGLPDSWIGDAGRLRQVLTNLLGNGIKFTESGFVRLSVGLEAPDRLRFEVQDSGIGIRADSISNLFQPFYQVDGSSTRKFGGTGLGLAISRQIVESMHGVIRAESEAEKGSRFTFHVEVVASPDARPPEPWPDADGKLALIVDPHAASRQLLRDQLLACGFAVREADSEPAALAALAAQDFAVLFIDAGTKDCEIHAAEIAGRTSAKLVLLTPSRRRPHSPPLNTAAVLHKPIRERLLRDALRRVLAEEPSVQPALSNLAGSLDSESPAGVHRGRILVAEDNLVNQRVAAHMIERRGFRVDMVQDGGTAAELARHHNYGLILMDCHMPFVDGFEATRRIRAAEGSSRHSPIVAMTARAMQGDRERCIAAGMDDYLSKPVDPHELDRVLEKWARAGRETTVNI